MTTYYLIGIVAFVVSMLIQLWLKNTYGKWSRVGNAAAVLFHLVTLPVEFNASRRALVQLRELGLISPNDQSGARAVLGAAAMTYVAAATAIAYLVYFVLASRR